MDVIARNDQGALATRQILAQELAAGRDRLDGKKIVIWQFAARELAVGDWQLISLNLGERKPSQFLSPPQGQTLLVEGTIAAISTAPRPGTVTYKDHILSLHLVDVVPQSGNDAGDINGHEAIVFLWSMKDNVRQSAAAMRPGDRVRLGLKCWNQELDRINRSELDDPDLQLEIPCWGEVVE